MDWDLLSNTLSPDALQALKDHVQSEAQDHSVEQEEDGEIGEKTEEDFKGEDQLREDDDAMPSRTSEKVAQPNHVFKLKSYWDSRFEEEESYEWLVDYAKIEKYIVPHINNSKSSQILLVGVGNSSFSSDLYDAGWKNLVNIDFSQVCIDRMSALHKETRPLMEWVTMDMTNLSGFADESFDHIIDKAAMDALMVDEGDVWDPAQHVVEVVDKMCCEMSRVLKPGGKYIQISFAQPHFRSKYLAGMRYAGEEGNHFKGVEGVAKRYSWDVSYQTATVETGSFDFFVYTCTKR
jgi:ubiquinone/menaquinone biosynthesis C-methylase UbiE